MPVTADWTFPKASPAALVTLPAIPVAMLGAADVTAPKALTAALVTVGIPALTPLTAAVPHPTHTGG